jgi:hypothetical protein
MYYFKSLTFFREITPPCCYFNIFRDSIISLRDLTKSLFSSFPCEISIITEPLPSYQQFLTVGVRGYESSTRCLAMARLEHTYIYIRIYSNISALWAECHISRLCPGIHNISSYNLRDQLLPPIYPWLRNRCLAINNSSLLVSADASHVPVA